MKLNRVTFNIQSIKSLFVTSFAIWLFTAVTYSLLSLLIESFKSHQTLIVYCGSISILLSMAIIVFFSDNKFGDILLSIIRTFFYGLLLYFCTNGIQAMYSAIQSPSEKSENQQAELIPFLDSRPWLPPAGMRIDLLKKGNDLTILSENNIILINSLDSVVSRLESCGLMTDSIFLTAIPTTREVAKGGVFRSEVVLAARLDKSYVKKISVNDSEIQLKNGIGVFVENTGNSNQMTRKLNYKAEIELYGEEKVITTSDSYRIIQPYIEVSSQAVNSLFLNCGNQLSIQVPFLGSDYKPTFKLEGGTFKYGIEPGNITVVPSSRQVDIDVYNKNTLLGKKTFPVRRVPSPTIHPFANGKPIDLNLGISKGTVGVTLSVHADEDFQRLLPNDANYIVQDCEISLISNGLLKSKMKGAANTNVISLLRKAKIGDQLKIEIKTVLRKNFKGDIVRVAVFHPRFFLIPLK